MTERDFVGNVNLKTLSSQCNKLITKQPYPTTCMNNYFQRGKSGPNLFTLVQKKNEFIQESLLHKEMQYLNN